MHRALRGIDGLHVSGTFMRHGPTTARWGLQLLTVVVALRYTLSLLLRPEQQRRFLCNGYTPK